jgi:hypothetical protein
MTYAIRAAGCLEAVQPLPGNGAAARVARIRALADQDNQNGLPWMNQCE